jgi:peptidyl-prolyl cis-trans isomerase D
MAMMGWMRRTSKYFLIVVILTFVASLAYFGATQDRAPADVVATVNGETISPAAYQRAYRQAIEQYRQAFKDRFSDELLKSFRVQEQVLERLVTERLMAQRARAEGLEVTDEELAAEITRISAFHKDGRFDRNQYHLVLRRVELTPQAFEQDMRADLLRRRLQMLVSDGAKVSEAEVRQHWEARRTRVRTAYLTVPVEPLVAAVQVGDADLEAHLKTNPARYARPERRRVMVATLETASVPPPPVTDAEVETAYQARVAEFEQPPRIRASHILVRVPTVGGSAAEDGARAKAEAARERVRGGADFAQVAREVSEDAATAPRGGELGLVARGELVPQFEEVAFGMKPGEVSGPVRSPLGYHVIKVTELVAGSRKELREVAAGIRTSLAAEAQRRLVEERAQQAQQALLTAADFAAEARARGLRLREAGPLARTDAIEGIGRGREVMDAVFALAPGRVSAPLKVPEGVAIVKLAAVEAAQRPEDVKLADVREQVAQAVRREKGEAAAEAKARQAADAWRAGQDPRELATKDALAFSEAPAFSRAEPLADRELGGVIGPAALTLPDGTVSAPLRGSKGFYVVKVVGRDGPDPAGFAAARAELERELLTAKRAHLWQAWLTALRTGAAVDINRTLLPPA